jgi:hypothetical protein
MELSARIVFVFVIGSTVPDVDSRGGTAVDMKGESVESRSGLGISGTPAGSSNAVLRGIRIIVYGDVWTNPVSV